MDRRFLTVLGVSLVFALVVSSVFYQMTSRSGTRKAEPTDMRDLVVTTRPLSVGALVKPADVKLAKVPAEGFPKGAYSKVEEVLDRGVISNMLLEEPILEGRLAAKGSGLGLATEIPVGMRAVTVRVTTSPTLPDSCCPTCTWTCWSRAVPRGATATSPPPVYRTCWCFRRELPCSRMRAGRPSTPPP
jgi:Flp pilus assembly protein CpaB